MAKQRAASSRLKSACGYSVPQLREPTSPPVKPAKRPLGRSAARRRTLDQRGVVILMPDRSTPGLSDSIEPMRHPVPMTRRAAPPCMPPRPDREPRRRPGPPSPDLDPRPGAAPGPLPRGWLGGWWGVTPRLGSCAGSPAPRSICLEHRHRTPPTREPLPRQQGEADKSRPGCHPAEARSKTDAQPFNAD